MDEDRTTEPAYLTAMRNIDAGMIAACVPVIYEGEPAVFTAGAVIENPWALLPDIVRLPRADDRPREDSALVAIAIINKARNHAKLLGGEPIG